MSKRSTISCIEAVDKMFELLDGALPAPQKEKLDEHVGVCIECCDRLEFEKLLKARMKRLGGTEKPPKNLLDRINKMIDES